MHLSIMAPPVSKRVATSYRYLRDSCVAKNTITLMLGAVFSQGTNLGGVTTSNFRRRSVLLLQATPQYCIL
jgi:hypothetical protein